MDSTPFFSFQYPALVCGSAACLFDDIERAKKVFGNLPIIAVNGAAKLVPAVAMYSKHPDRFVTRRWAEAQQHFFGKCASVHADVRAKKRKTYNARIISVVEYWWDGIWGGGGSAWDARKLAKYLGFSPVILCGCPLVAGPYAGSLSFGSSLHSKDVADKLFAELEREADWHIDAYSMSGRTRELLGEPC